jgi:hypothetical protein
MSLISAIRGKGMKASDDSSAVIAHSSRDLGCLDAAANHIVLHVYATSAAANSRYAVVSPALEQHILDIRQFGASHESCALHPPGHFAFSRILHATERYFNAAIMR